jgi:hypothetical protein
MVEDRSVTAFVGVDLFIPVTGHAYSVP